ncbi:hypothetical protein FQN57_006985 [Myotisia sp. PD_48]|nr:hypothetical protein FQN57_006985 [Myotisia sp. PD_48]
MPPFELDKEFITPPVTPTKPRLKLPQKEKSSIPPSPHRPSGDLFWSQNLTNEWNENFSPSKVQRPKFDPRNFDIFSDSEDDIIEIPDISIPNHLECSPDAEPASDLPLYASPVKKTASPRKRAATPRNTAAAKKREFDAKKAKLATEFFQELDDMVTEGEIQRLAKAAGGVHIIWNRKLATTAGRANWKKELIQPKTVLPSGLSSSADFIDRTSKQAIEPLKLSAFEQSIKENVDPAHPNVPRSTTSTLSSSIHSTMPLTAHTGNKRTFHHHATIELAEKIIDSEDRLLNTLAHEYCHLANFMISKVHDKPHGASFKAWAKKCKDALDLHPLYAGKVEINTKHSYLINYKYMWSCIKCDQKYGRHSKSIDPTKSRCGKCSSGELVQVKPKPRGIGNKAKKEIGMG